MRSIRWLRNASIAAGAAFVLAMAGAPAAEAAYCTGWSAGDYYYLHCRYDDGMHRLFVSGNGSIRNYAWYE